MEQLPHYFKLQFSSTDISAAISRIGNQVSSWAEEVWRSSHTDIVAVPVLRGGIFFFSDLVRHINGSVELAPARVSQYEDNANNSVMNSVKVDVSHIPARGRSILLIDDICDSGRTMRLLTEKLLALGADAVRSAVLIHRATHATDSFVPDWVGFEYAGPEWFVGYGMKDRGRWRNLPDIYTIQKSED